MLRSPLFIDLKQFVVRLKVFVVDERVADARHDFFDERCDDRVVEVLGKTELAVDASEFNLSVAFSDPVKHRVKQVFF